MRSFNTPLLTGPLAVPPAAPRRFTGVYTADEFGVGETFDAETRDSTGAFLVGELEKLDPRLNLPLYTYSWSRDIDLRSDVTLADEVTSFTNSTFAAPGGLTPNGKNWIGKNTNQIPGIALDIGKTMNPMNYWGVELSWSIFELAKGMAVGRPVDVQKYNGMQIKWNMDVDEQVYIGDSSLGLYGLCNLSQVTPQNVANNAAATSRLWINKTPAEILADVNEALTAGWAATGYKVVATKLMLAPANFSYLVATPSSSLTTESILSYLSRNALTNAETGRPLEIVPVKWLTNAGAGGAVNRMVLYTQDEQYVRFPMVGLNRTPMEFRSIFQLTTYYGALGVVEVPYAETIVYRDGM